MDNSYREEQQQSRQYKQNTQNKQQYSNEDLDDFTIIDSYKEQPQKQYKSAQLQYQQQQQYNSSNNQDQSSSYHQSYFSTNDGISSQNISDHNNMSNLLEDDSQQGISYHSSTNEQQQQPQQQQDEQLQNQDQQIEDQNYFFQDNYQQNEEGEYEPNDNLQIIQDNDQQQQESCYIQQPGQDHEQQNDLHFHPIQYEQEESPDKQQKFEDNQQSCQINPEIINSDIQQQIYQDQFNEQQNQVEQLIQQQKQQQQQDNQGMAQPQQPPQQKANQQQQQPQQCKSVKQFIQEQQQERKGSQDIKAQNIRKQSEDYSKKQLKNKPSSKSVPNVSSLKQGMNQILELQKKKQATIQEAYMTRKCESFELLNDWDQQKTDFLENHKEVCERIIAEMDKRVDKSQEIIQMIYKFFQQRKDNEMSYAKNLKHNMPKLSQLTQEKQSLQQQQQQQQSNSGGQNKQQQQQQQQQKQQKPQDNISKFEVRDNIKEYWYPDLAKAISKTDHIADMQVQKVQQFANKLDQIIIKEIFEPDILNYDNCIKKMKKQLLSFQGIIKKADNLAYQKQQKYLKIYQITIDTNSKKKKDLYNWELKYRKEVYAQMDQYKVMGKGVYSIWEETKQLELKRLQKIQNAFTTYIDSYVSTYGHTQELAQIKETMDNFKPSIDCSKHFHMQKILTQSQFEYITCNQKGSDQEQYKKMQNFLFNFKYPDIDQTEQHRLILKKYRAYKDIGTLSLTWKQVELVFTIDDFLLIFDIEDPNLKTLNVSQIKMECDKVKVIKREKNNTNNQLCYIAEKRQGIMFTTKNKTLLKFPSADCLQEFKVFLHRYNPEMEIND